MNSEDKELLIDHEKLQQEKEAIANSYAERQKFLDDIRKGVIDSPAGRRFIWDLLGLLGYQKRMFNTDPMIMAKNCGIHDDVLLIVIKDLEEAQPGILFRMQNEYRSAQANK